MRARHSLTILSLCAIVMLALSLGGCGAAGDFAGAAARCALTPRCMR